MASTAAPSLARSLRLWDLVGVVLNGVIGAGIFGLPSKIFSLTGADSIFAFGACAVCVSTFVLCFAEVASRYSGTGGPYLYARETYGPTVGFTVGWLVWMARLTSFAANSNLLPAYLDLFFPGAGSGVPRALIITGVVALLALLNVRGLPLAVFIIAGLLFLDPARFSFTMSPGYRPLTQSLLLLVYAFTGFEMAVIPAGEARKPERDLPRALLMGMATVVAFYVLIQVVCIGTLPGLAASQRPLADAANHFLGTWGAVMITVGIVISLAGNLNVLVLAASRVLFAMAENGELPRRLQQVHPRFRIPVSGVLWTSAAMLALTLSGTFIYLVTISAISRLVTYIVTCSALPVLRRRTTAPKAAFRMPAGVAVSLIGIVLALWLLSNITLREARDTALATAAGLCIYVFTRIFRSQRS